jgi:(R,R)-butanediol dehydrogenase / meso-butanediol dehydrogenase / diacetyl reductase
MKAARYYGRRDIRVDDVGQPTVVRQHQVLLRPYWSGICGTDLHEYTQGPIVIPVDPHPLNGSQLPQILGHEMSGLVEATGSDVRNVSVGDRVSVMPLIFCGACYYCARGLNHLCTRMACTGLSAPWGGIADLAVVEEYQVAKLPDTVSNVQAAVVEPAAVAAYGVDRSSVAPGEFLLITGAGPIGALAALYASGMGASVIVAEPNVKRAELIRQLDVGLVIDPKDADAATIIREVTDGTGVDAAVECSGTQSGLNLCIQVAKSRGTVVQTGLHTAAASIDPMQVSLKDLSIVGTWCYPVYDWDRIIRLIGAGRLPVERVVTSMFEMSQIVAGFELLLEPLSSQIKVLVGSDSGS